jgi:hypothetical protein
MRRALPLVLAALAAPAAAHAAVEPGRPPAICAGSAFADRIGTDGPDELSSPNRAERVYGLFGNDRMLGSGTRATCLFGGAGDDLLNLNAGGGVAWGEEGRDTVYGSQLGDVVDGGRDRDAMLTGAGPDKITSRDRLAEVVHCGDGEDIVRGDAADLYIGCESVTATGTGTRALRARPAVTDIGGTVRARFTAPRAGDYVVVYVTPAEGRNCSGGPFPLAALPGLRGGQRAGIVLERPERGWCEGISRAAVVRDPGGGLPGEPVARIRFRVL